MSELQLIALLGDGKFHSGAELGRSLGISRAAIWKQINKLTEMGVDVEAGKGRGYRIPGGICLLDRSEILQQLSPESSGLLSTLSIEQSVSSTNVLLRQCAEKQNASGNVIIAEQQTAGRGRRGRKWVSPYGRNIYLSLCWGFEGGVAVIDGLSLAGGVAVRRALRRCGVRKVRLKWPNDVLWQDKKLAGILLEIVGDPAGYCQVIIGIGINVDMREQEATEVDQAWASINRIVEEPVARSALAGCVLDELLQVVSEFEREGFSAYRREWMKYDAYADKEVTLKTVTQETRGVARGISKTGAIRLEVDGAINTFSGGEISMREASQGQSHDS